MGFGQGRCRHPGSVTQLSLLLAPAKFPSTALEAKQVNWKQSWAPCRGGDGIGVPAGEGEPAKPQAPGNPWLDHFLTPTLLLLS